VIEAKTKETIVRQRYAAGANARADQLCCPVDYQSDYLKVIPREVIERDYGCGDPSRYLREGEIVLDLGSGTGKICFIAAQIVGPRGKVIGVDMTDEMLEVARRNAAIHRVICAKAKSFSILASAREKFVSSPRRLSDRAEK